MVGSYLAMIPVNSTGDRSVTIAVPNPRFKLIIYCYHHLELIITHILNVFLTQKNIGPAVSKHGMGMKIPDYIELGEVLNDL